jgi:hypothetical protein
MSDYKAPVNFRATPQQVGSPESFTVTGGLALLAEAPANPAVYAMTVTIGGIARTRVDVAPAAGQYRVLTQTVLGPDAQPHLEYLPVLQFHVADEDATGLVDYFGTGTILTAQFFAVLIAFLTPLVGADSTDELPTPTMNQARRGRLGDVAFLADGSAYFSDGAAWVAFGAAGSAPPTGRLTLAQVIGDALDAGYVGPSFADDIPSFAATYGATLDGVWLAPNAWVGDTDLAQSFTATTDAVAAEVGALSVAQVLGMTLSAALDWAAAPGDFAATLGATLDGSYSGGGVAVSDNFTRANNASLGANWATPTGATPFAILTNAANIANGAGGTSGASYWSANAFADNQYAETSAGLGGTAPGWSGMVTPIAPGPAVRMSASARTFYVASVFFWDDGIDNGYGVALFKCVNGTFTRLAEASVAVSAAVVRIKAVGTTISVEVASAHGGTYTQLLSVTDASISSGSAGIASGYGGTNTIDNWYGGDL